MKTKHDLFFSLFPLLERCPTFRDQPPGSTATYNGKCYIFYNQQPNNFQGAMDFCSSRGGTLVDESNPALQGFLSWELWRRHKVPMAVIHIHNEAKFYCLKVIIELTYTRHIFKNLQNILSIFLS